MFKTIEETPKSHCFRAGAMSYITFLAVNPKFVPIAVIVAELGATPTNEVSKVLDAAV